MAIQAFTPQKSAMASPNPFLGIGQPRRNNRLGTPAYPSPRGTHGSPVAKCMQSHRGPLDNLAATAEPNNHPRVEEVVQCGSSQAVTRKVPTGLGGNEAGRPPQAASRRTGA